MTTPPAELSALRAEIDALNLRLGDLLQQRARLVRRIAQWKRAHGLPIADPSRETAMLAQVLGQAGDGFDHPALRAIFAVVFAQSRALAEQEAARPQPPT